MTRAERFVATKLSLDSGFLGEASEALAEANRSFGAGHPGDAPARQPVHTVYGGAQLFAFDTAPKIARIAQKAMEDYAPDSYTLGTALGIAEHPALAIIDTRIREKLAREPVEDFRIDFEDGYGNRPDAEEDDHAVVVASQLTRGMSEKILPPFIGIRIKPLNEELRRRSIRTLDIVMTALVKAGGIPHGWIVTVPKVTIIEQVEYIVAVFSRLQS